ncbi:MAG: site-2 protease family protein [Candidatus Bilamarchaeaceae archaeon]
MGDLKRKLALSGLVLLVFIALYLLIGAEASIPAKFLAALILLAASAEGVSRLTGLRSEWGIILLRTKKGMQAIRSLARHEEFWKLFADIGIGLSFGLLAFFAIKRSVPARICILLASSFLLTIILAFVFPFVLPFLSLSFGIAIGAAGNSAASSAAHLAGGWLVIALVYLGGISTMVTLSLLFYAFAIISSLVSAVFLGTGEISETSPGVTLLLPGINLPFLEGIIALFLILVVHEGAHAILSIIGRVPLVSSGIALFGVIPVGAFVEPDEKKLERKPSEVQTRVIAAGSAANLLSSLAFFILLLAFAYITAPYRLHGWAVMEGMQNGTIITSINGIPVEGSAISLPPNSTVLVQTNFGEVEMPVNESGGLGITYVKLSSLPMVQYDFFLLNFIFRTLALTFCLNFIIGTVNLLPLPFFDGYRLVELNSPWKALPKIIMYVCLLAFLLNVLPWLF